MTILHGSLPIIQTIIAIDVGEVLDQIKLLNKLQQSSLQL